MASSVPAVRQAPKRGFTLRVFGREITIAKSSVGATDLSPLLSDRGWFNIIREPFTGAWQRNREIRNETVIAHSAVYACVTLIAADISKMCVRLVEQDKNGIWLETFSSSFSPVLRKPNRYQNRIKFVEQWVVSKLLHGNSYILKGRDNRGVVVAMYVLDPNRTRPLVAPDGSVFYQCSRDNLSGIEDQVTIPASEIIHDTMVPLYHPLVGVSPLFACGVAAMQGLAIQASSTKFFQNGATPGGVLTAPGTIDEQTAKRLKDHWEQNYSGENSGRVAVLGDGLKYEKMAMTAVESQMIEQLKWTSETVCSCFHVPPYMIGVGPMPPYTNIEALNQQYYSQCLQAIIESIELCLDEGLGLPDVSGGKTYGTEFDLDGLLRMDTATQIDALAKAVGGSIMTPNAGLKKMNQPPVEGGDTVYMQQQNYSLAALSKRDAQADPFATAKPPPPSPADPALPPPAKAVDEYDVAAVHQIAVWSLKSELESQLQKLAA